MKELEIFSNEKFGKIRMVEIDNKPYFIASDIAKALGYTNISKAINDHCRWVTKRYIPHPQNSAKNIEVNVIPEGDMYRLITASKLPSAQEFELWVFDEVLPTLRKTGTYSTNTTYQYALPPATFEGAANLSRVIERVMKLEGAYPHEIAMVVKSVCSQAGIDLLDCFVKIPAYEQLSIFNDIILN